MNAPNDDIRSELSRLFCELRGHAEALGGDVGKETVKVLDQHEALISAHDFPREVLLAQLADLDQQKASLPTWHDLFNRVRELNDVVRTRECEIHRLKCQADAKNEDRARRLEERNRFIEYLVFTYNLPAKTLQDFTAIRDRMHHEGAEHLLKRALPKSAALAHMTFDQLVAAYYVSPKNLRREYLAWVQTRPRDAADGDLPENPTK